MKNFSKYITEKATDAGYPVDGSDFTNDLAKPETITRINAFLGSMGKMEYLVPEHALNKMQEKLGRLGISFDMPDLNFNFLLSSDSLASSSSILVISYPICIFLEPSDIVKIAIIKITTSIQPYLQTFISMSFLRPEV